MSANVTTCDATLCTDRNGVAGRVEIAVSTGPQESVPVGTCSDDRVTIWHGMDTPAVACGFHASYLKVAAFRGHRNREALAPGEVLT